MSRKEKGILISIFIIILIIIVLIILLNNINKKDIYKNDIYNISQSGNILINNESVIIDSEYGERDYIETEIEYNNKPFILLFVLL